MKPTHLAARVERLERQRDPAPGVMIFVLDPGETEEAARARAIAEHKLTPAYRGPVLFIDEVDAAA